MNIIQNDIIKKQYRRYLNGHVKLFKDGKEYLVSKGFGPISMKEFEKFMKEHDVEI